MKQIVYSQWMLFHAGWMILVTAFALGLRQPEIVVWGAFPSMGVLYWLEHRLRGTWRFAGEPANLLTGLRLAAVLSFLLVYRSVGAVWVAVLAVVVLIADGFDGWLARSRGTASDFGTWLDKETDALYVLLLAVLLAGTGRMAPWIVGVGLLRYLYYVAVWPWRMVRPAEPRFRFGKIIAAILMGTLPAGLLFDPGLYRPAIGLASLLAVFSFGASAWRIIVASGNSRR